jgi:hypothetical protein
MVWDDAPPSAEFVRRKREQPFHDRTRVARAHLRVFTAWTIRNAIEMAGGDDATRHRRSSASSMTSALALCLQRRVARESGGAGAEGTALPCVRTTGNISQRGAT